MSDISKKSREDALEEILAETAKNPYVSKRPLRPSSASSQQQKSSFSKTAAAKPQNPPQKQADLKSTEKERKPIRENNNRNVEIPVTRIPTAAQSAANAKAEAAKKVEEIKKRRQLEIQERQKQSQQPKLKNNESYFNTDDDDDEDDYYDNELDVYSTEKMPEQKKRSWDKRKLWDSDDMAYERSMTLGNLALDDILEIAEIAFAVMFAVYLILTFFIRFVAADTKTMSPAISENNKLLIRTFGYSPDNGDIVIIDNKNSYLISENGDVSENKGIDKRIVRRVIATEGQTIDFDFENGSVFVDGSELNESYIANTKTVDYNAFDYPLIIPDGYVFVMGDNRDIAKDSRHPDIGLVSKDEIVGKAVFKISPFGKLE